MARAMMAGDDMDSRPPLIFDLDGTGPAHRYRIQWLLFGIALLTIGALIGDSLYFEYNCTAALERDRLQVQARIVDVNLGRQLEGVNHAMVEVRDEFLPWGGKRTEQEASRHLRVLAKSIPGLRTIGILDAKGTALASSRDELIGKDFSEREFFGSVSARPSPDALYVSPPFNTALGAFSINLARAVVDPKGELTAVITATLAPEYFAVLLHSVLYTPEMRASVVHGDGRIVIAEPDRKDLAGMDLAKPGSRYTEHVKNAQAANIITGTAYSTGDQRMSAWRTIQPPSLRMDKPLMVSVDRDTAGIFASWRRHVYLQGGLFGVLLVVTTLGLLSYQRRQMAHDRLEASYAAERKRAEAALHQGEARYHELFAGIKCGVAVYSAWQNGEDFVITDLNPAGEQLEKITRQEVVGRRVTEVFPGVVEFGLLDVFRRVWKTGQAEHHPVSFYHDNRITGWKENYVYRLASGEIVSVYDDVTERKRAEDALHNSSKRLRELSQRLIEIEDGVRRTINRELHDRVGASLAALNLNLSIVRSQLPQKSLHAVDARLQDTQRLLEETTTHVRDLMADLHPPALDDYGLLAALRTHIEPLAKRFSVPILLHGEDLAPRLPLATETALFRVAQGALVNAVTHAHAKRIEILLAASPDRVALTIADDGTGFDVGHASLAHASWGLAIMRERAEAVGAKLSVESTPGKGTRVRVEIPREKR